MQALSFKINTSIILLLCSLFISLNSYAYPNTNNSYIINSYAGTAGGWNTSDNGECTSCHADNGSTGSNFTSLETLLAPNVNEYFYLNITSGPLATPRGGFNLKVVDSNGTVTGTLAEFDSHAVMDGNVARHTDSTDNSWYMRWTSPSSAASVRFAYCTNSINNNADGNYSNTTGENGDNIYCGYKAVTVNSPPHAVDDIFSVTQNHSSGYFYPITHGTDDSDDESTTSSLTLNFQTSSISGATLSCSNTNERCTVSLTSDYSYLDSGESVTLSGYRDYILNDSSWTSSNTRELTERTGRITVEVTGLNDAPTADNDSGYTINEGATSTTQISVSSLLAGDSDPDNSDTLTATFLGCLTNCSSVSLNGNYVSFTHDGSETTSASFYYYAYDGTTYSNQATVTVNITPQNDAPTADNDSGYTINEGATSTTQISLASLLSGDTDAEGDTLSVTYLSCGSNCSSVSSDGTYVIFTHDGSETTAASFTYYAYDGTAYSNQATVTVAITPQNDAPVADNDSGYSINEGGTSTTQISLASLLSGDTDAEGDSLSVTNLSCGSNCSSVSSNGTYVIFTHDGSETTTASFTYQANDGTTNSNVATVSLTINPQNDLPVANSDSGYTINEGATSSTEISLASLLTNDTDNDLGDTLSVTNLSCGSNCSSVSSDGTYVIFTHDGSETTTASFTYKANDGTSNSTNFATVSIGITPQNDAPIADNDSGYTINEGATSTTQISLASMLAGDSDVEGDSLSITNLSCATNCSSVSDNGTYVLFQHDGSETTSASFTYTANDGSLNSNVATVTLTITPINDAPIADNDSGYSINEGGTSTTQISLASLLSGDTDAEGDSLTVTNLTCTSNCTSISKNATYVLFEHDGSETTTASFSYTANDGTTDSNIATVSVTIIAQNDTPTASNDSGYSINEGATSTTQISLSSLLANDSDNEGDTLTVTNLTCVSNCNSISKNATYVLFEHDGSETTTASFTYTANDGTTDSNIATVSITIVPQNDAPVASDDSGYTILEGAASTTEISLASLLSNDTDNDGDSLSVVNLSCVSNCSSVNSNSTYVIFTHDGSETTSAAFSYQVSDGTVNSNVATVTLTITPQNDVPVAGNDSGYTINEGATSSTEISLANILVNDTDNDLTDTLSVTNLSCGSNCSSVSSNGTYVIFTHDDSETTTASFTYTANDGTVDSNVATVTVTITPVNDPPTISVTANDFTAGTGNVVGDVAANYSTSDAELASLTVNFTTGTNLNNHYTLDTVNKTVKITASAVTKINNGDNTLDTIDLTVTDPGSLNNSASDTPSVFAGSSAPTFNEAPQSLNINEDNSINVTYSATDSDNNDALIEWSVSTAPSNGSVSIIGSSTGSSAVFRYTPDNNYNGSDSFISQASSGGADITITTSLTVAAQNDAPIANNDSGYSLAEGSTSTTQISLNSLLTSNDTDVDGDSLSVTNLSCGLNCANVTANSTYVLFTHDGSETSTATFTYTANDGTVDSNIATVSITITGQNDAPVADNDSGFSAINEGATGTTEISISSLLAGDVDADGDSLSVTNLQCVSNCSSVSINGLYIAFTHDGSETTSASFSYTANDGTVNSNTALVTINITPVNDAPIADNDNGYNLSEGSTTTTEISIASLLAGDTDAEGDSLSVTNLVCATNCTSVSSNGTYIVFQHDGTETSNASFTYTANDGTVDSNAATVTINIIGNNDAPVADNDSGYTINEAATSTNEISLASLLSGDTDADGDPLTVTNLSCVTNCSAVSSNATHVLFQHDGSETTTASFSYTANDGTVDSNIAIVTIAITPQNDAPIADNDSGYSAINEGATTTTEISLASLLAGDTDAEGDSLSVTNLNCVTNCASVISNGTYILFTHDSSETTTASFSYTANDGSLDSNVALVSLNITLQNDAPIAFNDNGYTIIEGGSSTTEISLASVLSNDSDGDGDSLTVTNLSCVSNCSSVTANATHIIFVHDGSETTSASFDYTANDGTVDSNSATVTLSITPQNDAPIADNDSGYTLNEGATSSTEIAVSSLLSNDADVENNSLSVTNLTCLSNCSSISQNNGFILFKHDGSETTSASFTYTANDGTSDSNVATVSLAITPQDDAPIANNDAGYTLLEGATSTTQISLAGLISNDSDAENSILSVTNLACGLNCKSISTSGLYVIFEHDGSETSTATFTYTANDGSLNSNIATGTIVITSVNDAPVITEGSSVSVSMSEDSAPNAFNLTLNATDIENDSLTWSVSSNGTNGVASISGGTGFSQVINYIPNTDFSGTDSFIVQVSDATLSDNITVNVTINSSNDAPVITQVSDQTLLEGETLTFTASVTDIDPTDLNDGLGSLTWSISSGNDGTMTLSNTGVFQWTAPQTGQFNRSVPIQFTVTDGLEDGTSPATMTFTLTVNPVDDDSDGVANYDDFCPSIADPTNLDTDGDGTAGTDADPNDNTGGDACDLDDDNDGMPDTFEDANKFDSKDASDANLDFDGDGVSNLDEFLAGSNPLLATLNIDATGYLTAYQLVEPDPTLFNKDATLIFADNYGPYRPGTHIIKWQLSNSETFNLGTVEQILNINPLVSLSANQQTAEGETAVVTASINGNAVTYPVVINYSVSGTADSTDHDAQDGVIMITTGNTEQSFSFNVLNDSAVEDPESVIFTIDSVTNAVKSMQSTHTATILEGNVKPKATITFSQNGLPITTAHISDGDITISVNVTDANSAQNHTVSWLGSDSQLAAPTDMTTLSWTYTPTASGSYKIVVDVADDGSPSLNSTINSFLVVSNNAVPTLLPGDDSDGDGIDDFTEGYDDTDNDGVPDYLDAIEPSHLQVDQTVDEESTLVLQTESGLSLKIGDIARVSETSGTVITDSEIKNFGSSSGGLVSNFSDSHIHIGGIYDFIIDNLIPGSSAHLVVPLQIAIPNNAVYRKYTATNGWNDFVVDSNNQIYSAVGDNGACPEPLSNEYKIGLHYLDTCLQLKIEDGGPNDQDNSADGRINDPGVISFKVAKVEEEQTVEEGGEIPLWFILMLSLLLLRKTNNKNYE